MSKAPNSGRVLSSADAALIKSMIARDDRQHDIAAYFAVNGGRIGEISKGRTFGSVTASMANVPPSAPYLVVPSSVRSVVDSLAEDLDNIGAPKEAKDKLNRVRDAMEASKVARRGK